MIIGLIKEIKTEEYRVALTPSGVEILVNHGHSVLVETEAGLGSGFSDEDYVQAGAKIISSAAEVFASAEMIMKVKEPLPVEYSLIREDQILFTYLHFAASESLTKSIIQSKCVAIAYETVESLDGRLPLLAPMSEVAGRISVQQAARFLEKPQGGKGMLLSGVPGVQPAIVVVFGGGVVGINAAFVAAGMGAKVYILDLNLDRLRYLSEVMPKNVTALVSSPANVRRLIKQADVIISGVLIKGAKAPKLVTREMLQDMQKGTVLIDVAIDQGGSFECSRPTTHKDPIFEVDGIIHYCVANMPGATPITSTAALTNATLPYALEIANKGWKKAAADNKAIAKGVNMVNGKITYQNVADAFGLDYTPLETCLS